MAVMPWNSTTYNKNERKQRGSMPGNPHSSIIWQEANAIVFEIDQSEGAPVHDSTQPMEIGANEILNLDRPAALHAHYNRTEPR
jgi:hypothetical protein